MSRRQARIQRMLAVEREYSAATVALDLLEQNLRINPGYLAPYELRKRDASSLRGNLAGTFIIRIYAEFESGLRDVWRHAFRRLTHPATADLLEGIAARRRMPQDWLDRTHEVRAFRNFLVHEDAEYVPELHLAEVRRRLCRFFSRVPSDW